MCQGAAMANAFEDMLENLVRAAEQRGRAKQLCIKRDVHDQNVDAALAELRACVERSGVES